MTDLTVSQLREALTYDSETGCFTWLTPRGKAKAGSTAGTIVGNGYRHITVFGRQLLAHRLAWLYVHGRWPAAQIDHINGNRDDNRITNLREAIPSQNSHNSKLPVTNTSGFKGVSWHVRHRKWIASIRLESKLRYLGSFDNVEDAARAYAEASKKLHGEFARVS
jgi:hypothetical protein